MQFSTVLVLLTPLLPSILAAPSAASGTRPSFVQRRAPTTWSDIGDDIDNWWNTEGQAWLDDLKGLADDVREDALAQWDYETDGCKVVQCAAHVNVDTLDCVTGAVASGAPLTCLSGVSTPIHIALSHSSVHNERAADYCLLPRLTTSTPSPIVMAAPPPSPATRSLLPPD